eukprot:scaffold313120_cov33-Tisochrysis_lutea.AAC.3
MSVHRFAEMVDEENRKKASKPKPQPAVKAMNAIQRILADQPQTTSREIGNHKIPTVPATTPRAPQQRSEYEEMRSTFPRISSEEVGFHPTYGKERAEAIANTRRLVQTIKTQQVCDDPELRAGIEALRARVLFSLSARRAR